MDLLTYFEAVYRNFQDIQKISASAEDYNFRIADRYVVSIKPVNNYLAEELTPGFSHLRSYDKAPSDLTIFVWDSSGDPKKLAPYPFWNDGRGMLYRDFLASERIAVACDLDPNRLSLLDAKKDMALYWIDNANKMPYYEKGSPFRFLLHWWLSKRGCQFVHAAAVGREDGGVLIGGGGGSGKSTAALACLDSDLLYAGDDYCLITLQDSSKVYSIYNTAKLKGREDIKRFPGLANLVVNPDRVGDEKAIMFLGNKYKNKMAKGFPLKAILLPKFTGRKDTRLKNANSNEALKSIFPSTATQARGYGVSDFYSVYKLAKKVPSYILETGTDLEDIPRVISKLLSEI